LRSEEKSGEENSRLGDSRGKGARKALGEAGVERAGGWMGRELRDRRENVREEHSRGGACRGSEQSGSLISLALDPGMAPGKMLHHPPDQRYWG
jgi:hypothetical protein